MMSTTNLKSTIGIVMLATASSYSVHKSVSSSANWTTAVFTAGAAVFGVVAVMKLVRRQGRSTKSSSRHPSADDTSDTISVEGSVMVTLPSWAIASSEEYFSRRYMSDEEMMSLAIHLSDRNITEGTGGPFGAAIFERHEGRGAGSYCTLVSIGMNRVVTLGNSTLHGETVAIQLAQRRVGSYTLRLDEGGGDGSGDEGLYWDEGNEHQPSNQPTSKRQRQFELFTSCEPCAMCLGATLWSGVTRIVCGATKDDAQSIGFDEGPVFEESYKHLEKAGIQVTRNVLRAEAAKVLQRYGCGCGPIYNGCK
jgi:tRNA(Arg) A34 adenosine deaminase TadA